MSELNIEILQQGGLLVGTPMYGLQAVDGYICGLTFLAQMCGKFGIDFSLNTLSTPLVQVSRNLLVDDFLKSDATHMMMIDADMGFNPLDVLYMKYLMTNDSEYDILAAPYPKKQTHWPTIRKAIGMCVKDDELDYYTFEPASGFNFMGQTKIPDTVHTPSPIEAVGTGFMMVRRSAFEKIISKFPEHRHRREYGKEPQMQMFFHCQMAEHNGNPVYEGEDYYFCRKAKEAGCNIFMCPWMQVTHTGPYTWKGTIDAWVKLDKHKQKQTFKMPHASTAL